MDPLYHRMKHVRRHGAYLPRRVAVLPVGCSATIHEVHLELLDDDRPGRITVCCGIGKTAGLAAHMLGQSQTCWGFAARLADALCLFGNPSKNVAVKLKEMVRSPVTREAIISACEPLVVMRRTPSIARQNRDLHGGASPWQIVELRLLVKYLMPLVRHVLGGSVILRRSFQVAVEMELVNGGELIATPRVHDNNPDTPKMWRPNSPGQGRVEQQRRLAACYILNHPAKYAKLGKHGMVRDTELSLILGGSYKW